MDKPVPFASPDYFIFVSVLVFARAADFVSTWVATPNLVLEGNPIAKRLGWKLGLIVNALLCLTFGLLPFIAVVISTTSMLVAARNFQQAWLMRTLGEENYRDWHVARIFETHPVVYWFCLLAQTALFGLIGWALVYFARSDMEFAIGFGIIGYAATVLFYTSLSVWRIRRRMR